MTVATPYVTLDDQRCTRAVLHVPARGPWHAEIDLESDPEISERCTLAIGELRVTGTVAGLQSGSFGRQRRVRIVGGGGGWGSAVGFKAYHNDAGVKALLVAQDAARDAGETLGGFVPARERIGNDYVRDNARVASQVLADAIGEASGVAWWVDFAGVTHVGQRPTAPELAPSHYQLIAYDPRERMLTLAIDDPALLQIGTMITADALPEAQAVREYEVQADAEGVRILVWSGGNALSAGRLAELWRNLVQRVEGAALFGLYRYRVIRMATDGRVSLQSVRKAAGLPDIEPISQWPGVAGAHAELTPGGEVLVGFIEGDRTQPVIVSYGGKAAPGFAPVSLVIGGEPAQPAARLNDQVTVLIPPMQFVGTITLPSGPATATGVVSPTLQQALGLITTGSSKVRVAT